MKSISLPSSKSISNRALILASISDAPVLIKNLLESDDTRYLRGVLANLGVEIEARGIGEYLIKPPVKLQGKDSDNFIGNAGTAARFAVGLSLITEGAFSLKGIDRMHERPFVDLFEAIKAGVKVQYQGEEGFLPVTLSKHEIIEKVSISGAISSQFITALLLVGAKMPQGLMIEIIGSVPSQPYIDMTLELLRIWGIKYEVLDNGIKINPGIKSPQQYTIPPDMSAASVPLALSLMLGEDWKLDYDTGKTLQGDEAFGEVIKNIGGEMDFETCPDVSMTGMVLAAASDGVSHFKGLESLRVKECDRIEAMREGLENLGFEVSVEGDEVTIMGDPDLVLKDDVSINAYDDHRIAFCFGILLYRLGIKDVREIQKMIINPECVSKTWPDFWLDLATWTDQLRPVSGVVLKNKETYLLVKKPRKDHAWQLPQGGVDPGETGIKAARRELAEECGSELVVKWCGERPVGQYRYFFPDDFKRHDQNITGACVSFFQGTYIEGDVELDENEIIDYKWATRDEIQALVDKPYWEVIAPFLD